MDSKLKVSSDLTGKMKGMVVITTSMTNNPNCEKCSHIHGSICEHCYSKKALSYRPNVKDRYELNGKILSSAILPDEELPILNAPYVRFESHGDLINETHLENYINICKKNRYTHFALWTKNYNLILNYFKSHKKPSNLNIVISSLMLNVPISPKRFDALGLNVKTFTVYDKEHAEHVDINCGGRCCLTCLKCYTSRCKTIKEQLK